MRTLGHVRHCQRPGVEAPRRHVYPQAVQRQLTICRFVHNIAFFDGDSNHDENKKLPLAYANISGEENSRGGNAVPPPPNRP